VSQNDDVSTQIDDVITGVVNVSSMVLEVVYIYSNSMYQTLPLAEAALTFIYRRLNKDCCTSLHFRLSEINDMHVNSICVASV